MKLGRSFLTLYFLITSVFIFASWMLDEGWRSYLEQDIESYTGYKLMLNAFEGYLTQQPEDKWPELIEKASIKYKMPISIIKIKDIEFHHDYESELLKSGKTDVYYTDDKVELHHLISGTDYILTFGPTKMPTRPREEAAIRVILLCLLAFIILIWLYPMSRDLDKLRKSANQFGAGNFDTIAPHAQSAMVVPMVQAFNMMAKRIKSLMDAHKELTSAVSHELRTPLARSKFALQMLSSTQDSDKQLKYRKQIEGDIHELEELINELLMYASFDNDRPNLTIKVNNLSELIHQQVELNSTQVEKIEVQLPSEPIRVFCDSYFIERAINNYIANAIKYGNGHVRVGAKVQYNRVVVWVEDNGQGVSDSFKHSVFEPFSRGDQSRNRETGGFGLGLAIVSRILEWHNGSVGIENSELGGAQFIMSWPIE